MQTGVSLRRTLQSALAAMETHCEGDVTFPSKPLTPHRYKILRGGEQIKIWLRDRTSYHEWHDRQHALPGFPSELSRSVFADVAACRFAMSQQTWSRESGALSIGDLPELKITGDTATLDNCVSVRGCAWQALCCKWCAD